MSDIAIQVHELGKRYRLGERERYVTFRDLLARTVSAPARMLSGAHKPAAGNGTANGRAIGGQTHLWALKDVSFQVRQGEVVGIIGRNGAGKSTLLKILARVTKPTTGFAEVRGRMGSLLEVGTGFHPELTGRENVFLNGAILGMSKAEIHRKFDEIVAFAEIEKFIDTPIKHYSSGMQVRLAFSVAAHLEPEILLIDEVLAVGDVAFQKKCLGRMGAVAKQGRTILFVSHSMAAVAALCQSAVVLDRGQVSSISTSQEGIAEYLNTAMDRHTTVYNVENVPRPFHDLDRQVEFLSLELEDCPAKMLPMDSDIRLRITIRGNQRTDSFRFALTVFRIDGSAVGTRFGPQIHSIQKGEAVDYQVTLPQPGLAPGLYYFGFSLGTGNEREGLRDFDVVVNVVHFEVLATTSDGGAKFQWHAPWGPIRFQEIITEPYPAMRSAVH